MLCKKTILSAACTFLTCVMLAQGLPQKVSADKIVATVGDHIILASEIQRSVDQMAQSKSSLPSNLNCIAVEEAIVSKMLMTQALRDSLPVSDDDVENGLDRLAGLSVKGVSDENLREQILQMRKQVKPQMKEWMLTQAMQAKIVSGITVSPAEVKAFFENIPADNIPLLEPQMEVGQIVLYPRASKELEQYVINEMNNYKKQVENKDVTFCKLKIMQADDDVCNDYTINRNSPDWDHDFISAAFRLKQNEISAPVKCEYGYYLIQMVERKGDNAVIRYVFRPCPVTDVEITAAKSELAKIRRSILDGLISFNDAAANYHEAKKNIDWGGIYFLNPDQSSLLTADQLDPEVESIVEKMNTGEISTPILFVDNQGNKGVRIIYLKSRSAQHALNLRDDYLKISQMALKEKRSKAIERWINSRISALTVMLDPSFAGNCPELQRFWGK